ncbi:MAG: 50S ribosomal protein L15e [Candidatus Woesearchaeota archaeon]
MGYLKYVKQLWKKPKQSMPELWRERLISWRQGPSSVRVEKPTRIDRARSLGYKAKQGFVLIRQRVPRGGRMRAKITGGRRSKAMRRDKVVGINYQQVSEQRAQKKHINCEVLNSYWLAEDGIYVWYEVILVDKDHPQIINDKQLGWISKPQHRGRVYRGLTSSARKARGLTRKGKGAEKIRPSQRANKRLAK